MTDLHSYLHGSYGLLKFGIGALLLEADPGHRVIRPTYILYCFLFYFCDIVCLPVLFNEYLWHVVGRVNKKSNRKTMNRNWSNQKANPALKTKIC